MISPPRVVSVGIQIITRSREGCIDLLIRNINIISNRRTVIYLMSVLGQNEHGSSCVLILAVLGVKPAVIN
jgi:hypothetical protein